MRYMTDDGWLIGYTRKTSRLFVSGDASLEIPIGPDGLIDVGLKLLNAGLGFYHPFELYEHMDGLSDMTLDIHETDIDSYDICFSTVSDFMFVTLSVDSIMALGMMLIEEGHRLNRLPSMLALYGTCPEAHDDE
jgi:hypothetical protein